MQGRGAGKIGRNKSKCNMWFFYGRAKVTFFFFPLFFKNIPSPTGAVREEKREYSIMSKYYFYRVSNNKCNFFFNGKHA